MIQIQCDSYRVETRKAVLLFTAFDFFGYNCPFRSFRTSTLVAPSNRNVKYISTDRNHTETILMEKKKLIKHVYVYDLINYALHTWITIEMIIFILSIRLDGVWLVRKENIPINCLLFARFCRNKSHKSCWCILYSTDCFICIVWDLFVVNVAWIYISVSIERYNWLIDKL